MRRFHPLELAAFVAVAVPNVLFSLACVPPGCGSSEGPPAPERSAVTALAPGESTEFGVAPVDRAPLDDTGTDGSTGDTAADTGAPADTGSAVPLPCDEAPPSLTLSSAGDPAPGEVWLTWGGEVSCGGTLGPAGVPITVSAAGLARGPVDVAWTIRIAGRETTRLEGTTTWDHACGASDPWGSLVVALAEDADGADVTVEVDATDALGVNVSDAITFVAHVADEG